MIRAYIQIIAACLIWGTYGLFVKKLGYSPEVIVFFRFFFGAVFLALFFLLTGSLARLKPNDHTRTLLIAGFVNTGSWLLLTRSIDYTSVATGFILNYTAPCFVVLLAPLVLKERFEKKSLGALVLAFAGIILIAGYSGPDLKSHSLWGSIMGLSSGLLYAFYIVALKRVPSELLGLVSNFYICATIALFSFPLAALSMPSFTLSGILLLVLMGAFVQVGGTTLYMLGLRRAKAQHASILSYFEALFAMLYAALFLHDRMTPAFFAGVALVIAGSVIILSFRKEESTSES